MKVEELRDFEAKVNKALGEDLLISFDENTPRVREGLSSGSILLNDALSGTPTIGYVWGRIAEIYGPEQSGKTTLSLHAVRECQKRDLPVLFVDAEHALDIKYAKAIGIDLKKLSINQPDYGEQALAVVEHAIVAGYRLIIVDSVPALVPKRELDGEMGDSHIGLQARLMGQAMRKLTGKVAKSNAIVVFVNQIRMKIGVMFGNPEDTPGGKALKYASSYRIEVRSPRGGAIQEKKFGSGKAETGIVAKVKIVKNKLFSPYRRAELIIRYGKGIDRSHDAVEYLRQVGIIEGNKRVKLGGKTLTGSQLEAALRKDLAVQKGVSSSA